VIGGKAVELFDDGTEFRMQGADLSSEETAQELADYLARRGGTKITSLHLLGESNQRGRERLNEELRYLSSCYQDVI
jgi:hypothetical protein